MKYFLNVFTKVEQKIKTYKILVEKPLGKCPTGRFRRWETNGISS
jgi:hypothetical protein